ncbi:MAG: DUF1538 domain-containing protein [Firmicutes bacterium]|nr:DUF1538 domain-containing protein [Bacillota bacterium]
MPISLIVLALCLTLIPIESGLVLSFVIGCLFLTQGMTLFNLGSDMSMTQIGNHIGSKITKTRSLPLILAVSFMLGTAITVSEPDLSVLAGNVPAIDSYVLVFTVAVGVGLFLMVAMLRIIFAVPIKYLLLVSYGLIFIFAAFTEKNFLSVAFDSGGVTTGPMTVPFIMSMGMGVAAVRSDSNARSDGFGLVALCSIGPVLAVMLLGFIYPETGTYALDMSAESFPDSVAIGFSYIRSIPSQMIEVAKSLLPIFAFFLIFQVITLHLRRRPFMSIMLGIGMTYAGLVIFMTGVNVGFSSLGFVLGQRMAEEGMAWFMVPVAMIMGWFIINAEPAVHTLTAQVEELSCGSISGKAMRLSLSVAIAAANGFAMLRVISGVNILYFLVPGYALSLALAFYVPQNFTAIAFDSGGVASGPLTASFMLPMAMGACSALGGNLMTDAFGLVALVAMMPLITVQGMGALAVMRSRSPVEAPLPSFADSDVIELWEV